MNNIRAKGNRFRSTLIDTGLLKSIALVAILTYPISSIAAQKDANSKNTVNTQTADSDNLETKPETNNENQDEPEKDSKTEILVVTGRPIKSYSAVDSLTGTKTNALLKDLPVAVSVVPKALIEDRAMTSLVESLDNVSGAQRKQGYGGTQNFGAFLRGFDSSFLTLRNGVRDAGFYTLRDTANVERFEVLKGPGSVLYGALQPGGITNTITKKPTSETFGRLFISAASHNGYRTELDLSGKVNDTTFYRITTAVDDAESYRDQVENKGYFISPVVSFQLNEDLVWTLEAERRHSEFTWDLGLPKDPISLTLPVSRFFGEPETNDVTSTSFFSTIDYDFSKNWSLKQSTSYAKTDGDYKLRSPFTYNLEAQNVNRFAFDSNEKASTLAFINDFVGNFETGEIQHKIVIGFDHYNAKQSYYFDLLSLPPIDIYNPVYGQTASPLFPLFAEAIENQLSGVYVQNLMSIQEQWKLLVGVRHDQVKYEKADTLNDTTTRETKDNATSPQVGLVFQPNDSLSIYASYSESFSPVFSGRTFDQSTLKPQEGKQYEVGVKKSWLDDSLSTSLAIYDITKSNVNTPDPEHVNFILQTGEQKSKGVELDISGSFIEGWDIIYSAAYTDAYVSKDNLFSVGSELVGIPKYSASLWNKYTIQQGRLQQLSLALGAYYSDKRQTSLPNNDWNLPAYTRFDAMLSYPIGKVKMQLNLKNLTDKKIYDLSGTSMLPQASRTISISASYSFL